MKKKLSLLLILLFALTLSACIFNQSVGDEKERVAAEEELIQLFKDYGFKGKVSVENATGKTFETSIYSANVTYVEDLNGQELSFVKLWVMVKSLKTRARRPLPLSKV